MDPQDRSMTLPAPPSVSEDGRFWWDGERWQPFPAAGSNESRTLRNIAVFVVGLFVIPWAVYGIGFIALLAGGAGPNEHQEMTAVIVFVLLLALASRAAFRIVRRELRGPAGRP